MPRPAAKLSVSVPGELARSVRKYVGKRGLSGFVALAMQHELERRQLRVFLDEMDDRFGPPPPKLLDETRAAWRKR